MGNQKGKEWYNVAYELNILKKGSTYMKTPGDTQYINVWNKVIEIINEKKFRAVLDIGCGPGQFGKLCLGNKIGYIGWDYSETAIKMAKKLNEGEEYRYKICSDITKVSNITFPGVITMLEVLEHITEDIKVLNRTFCKLLIFTVPNYDYKSHVRHFKSSEEVRQRYADVVPIESIIEIPIGGDQVIYIVTVEYEKA